MEPDVSVEGAATIRVVILQVGDISSSVFRDYASLVMRQCQIDLSNVRSFYTEIQKSPFASDKYWEGSLRFKYILGSSPRNVWEDFQAHRKIHGVIGICHCPRSPDIGEAYEDFMRACRAYPSAQARRCFAFDPSEEQVAQDDNKRKHLILFPWGDPQKPIGDMMLDFASAIVMAFESWVVHAAGTPISTPLDSQASLSSEEVRKRGLGRTQKVIGDYCLLAGSPLDAHKHYRSSLELTRLSNDLVWQAGALEGITTAIVMDTGEKTELLEATVRDNYKEVLQLYRRSSVPLFELEAAIKLARFLCRKDLAKHVVELLSGAVEEGRKLVNASDRVVLFVEAAKLYAELGYRRKAAFFARAVAQLYATVPDSRYAAISALQALSLTATLYRVQPESSQYATSFVPILSREGQEQSKVGSRATPKGLQKREGEWTTLQIAVLGDIVSMAMKAGEPLVAWGAAARLLRNHYPLVTPKGQEALAEALSLSAARLPQGTRSCDPALPYIRLHSFPSSPGSAQTVKRTPGKKDWWNGPQGMGPFIYTPFTSRGSPDKDKAETLWVAGEIAQVMVEVANPCAFDLHLDRISLSVSGDFEAFPVELRVPGNTSSLLLPLAGVARTVGPATVRGCFVRCFGVLSEHRFDLSADSATASLRPTLLTDPFRGSDSTKRYVAPVPQVVVLPPLPLLVAEWAGGEGAPVLFEGEMRELHLKLTNVGAVAAESMDIAVLGRQKEHVSSLDYAALEKALPLLPGASVSLTVGLLAQFLSGDKPEAGRGKGGFTSHTGKEDPNVVLAIHYAGLEESVPAVNVNGREEEKGSGQKAVIPGRRLAVPLELHVQRGLRAVHSRLLAMGASAGGSQAALPADAGKTVRVPLLGPSRGDREGEMADVPVREGKGLRLLEVELWNGTDVGFEVFTTVTLDQEAVGESASEGNRDVRVKREVTQGLRCTRIDRECSARVLIPLEPFQVGSSPVPSVSTGSNKAGSVARKGEVEGDAEAEAAVEAICARLSVTWQSGRNSAGRLDLRKAVRQALHGSSLPILLPDLVSFTFQLRAAGSGGSGAKSEKGDGSLRQSRNSEELVARELTLVDLIVHNNSDEKMLMSLSVTCRDVRGASCMGGGHGQKATALWAGVMNGAEVEVPARGEAVHQFYLCFLIPGDYSLLAAALVELSSSSATSSSTGKTEPQQLCCSGLPHKVAVGANVGTADLSMLMFD